jgi:hypothetical protein
MENLEQRIQKIEERNRGVELDKAWETSAARRVILATFSYLVVAIFFVIIELPNPWLNALVPALAFLVQQLSMPYFKKLWLRLRK